MNEIAESPSKAESLAKSDGIKAEAAATWSAPEKAGSEKNTLLELSQKSDAKAPVVPAKEETKLSITELAAIGEALASSLPGGFALGAIAKVYANQYMTAATLDKLEDKARQGASKTGANEPKKEAEAKKTTDSLPVCSVPQSLDLKDLQWAIEESQREKEGKGSPLLQGQCGPTRLSENDEKYLQLVVENRDIAPESKTDTSALKFCNLVFSDDDWLKIGDLINLTPTALDMLPDTEISADVMTNPIESNRIDQKITTASSTIETDGDKVTVTDKTSGITTVKEGNGTRTTLKTGAEITTDGDKTRYTTSDGITHIEVDKDGPDTFRLSENRFAKKNGELIEFFNASGEKIGQLTQREYYMREKGFDIFLLRETNTAEEALEAWTRNHALLQSDSTSVLFRDNGASIVENGRTLINFERGENGIRSMFYFSDERQLLRDEKGRHFIIEAGKAPMELTAEEVNEILKPLGHKRDCIKKILEALETGRTTLGSKEINLTGHRPFRHASHNNGSPSDASDQTGATQTPDASGEAEPEASADPANPDGVTYTIIDTNTRETETFTSSKGSLELKDSHGHKATVEPQENFAITTADYQVRDGVVIIPDSNVTISET
ncbi:MAG: hypothetical protein K8F91_01515, partial [Candidatus Obscuribacterales bacterium]|nr:hypothetical protein [Candidatus Obscuribacterales bacterium]